jgi:tRNA uridine 5-carbamoylmethylation protein Kti12
MFSEIVFFVDGNVENASPIAYEVINQIETKFDVPKKRIVLTMTEIENIIFFFD